MATITWPSEKLQRRDELEEKIIAAYACAASIVEQTRHTHVEHAKTITVTNAFANSVYVTITTTDRYLKLIDICKIYFEYCPESKHWYMGSNIELVDVAVQIGDKLCSDEYEWDTYGEIVLAAIDKLYHKIAVDIESKY